MLSSNKNVNNLTSKTLNFNKNKQNDNIYGKYDIVCKFALCTFNLLDRVENLSWLFK